MAPSQNADDGNCPDCHKSLVVNTGHLENIFYNQMSPVFYPCTQCASIYSGDGKYSHPLNFAVIVMVKAHVKIKEKRICLPHQSTLRWLRTTQGQDFRHLHKTEFLFILRGVRKHQNHRRRTRIGGSMAREEAQRGDVSLPEMAVESCGWWWSCSPLRLWHTRIFFFKLLYHSYSLCTCTEI